MPKKVIVIFPEERVSQEGLGNYTSRITKILQAQLAQEVKPFFHQHGHDKRSDLVNKLNLKPMVIAFDECHPATIKKIYNEIKRVEPDIVFFAKNHNIEDHGISGINTIDTLGKIPLFLTSLGLKN